MLGKLIKYEIKSIYKYFLILYAIIIAGAITSFTVLKRTGYILEYIGISSSLICFLAIMVLSVLLLVFTITRFNSSLLGDEGYLMFTVPTSTHNIIWSKALAMLIFNLASILVILLVAFGFLYSSDLFSTSKVNIEPSFLEALKIVFKNPSTYLVVLLCIFHVLVSILSSTMLVYAALSFGQMPTFKKYKNIFAIGFFIIFSVVEEYITSKLGYVSIHNMTSLLNSKYTGLFKNIDQNIATQNMEKAVSVGMHYVSGVLFVLLLMYVSVLIIEYFVTYYILNKKLNLD
nr:ABC transporter ATP-binding protein [uncultured Peptostreptococcus sp.]